MKPRPGSQRAIEGIFGRYPLVYLGTSPVGVRAVKVWLKENGFAGAPVVAWRQGAVFEEIVQKGFSVKAVVGGPAVIESMIDHRAIAFSFQQAEGADLVNSWEEISEKLKSKSDE